VTDDPAVLQRALDDARERVAALERDNSRLLRRLAEQQQLADAARVASIAVLEHLDLRDVLDTLLDCIAPLVPFDAACVMLLSGDHMAVMAAGIGYDDPVVPGEVVLDIRERPHLDELVSTMRSVRIPDTASHPGWQHGIEVSATTRSWLGVPLVARGHVLGLYGLDKRQPDFFTDAHVRLAEGFADHAALAIANARLYQELRREAGRP
jgi:GAF domain-containing protein